MSLFENAENMKLLQKLLSNPAHGNEDSDSDEEPCRRPPPIKMTPADIAGQPQTKPKPKNEPAAPQEPKIQSIEEWEAQQQKDAKILETRATPEYTMKYRQKVGTEDVFFQLNNRTSATASCEDLVLEIQLPLETTPTDKIQLTVKETSIELSSCVYYLMLPMTHNLDVDRCSAKYLVEKKVMELKLRLKRELDFINF